MNQNDKDTKTSESIDKDKAKPFIKWVGGKGKLINELEKYFPNKINRYFEPFCGGGAVYFYLNQSRNIDYCSINDINNKLITSYKKIKHSPNQLLDILKKIDKEYKNLPNEEKEKYYYDIRRKYNSSVVDELTTTAFLIFLNKTCFNGMYRENSKGEFNIPFGRVNNPNICNEKNILSVSQCLKNTEITSSSFEESVKECKSGDFIYLDPPYYPVNATSDFTNYSKNAFGPKEQEDLKNIFVELAQRGCNVMLSNSDTDFIKNLYADFLPHKIILASRSINSNGSKRTKVKELVITNYKI